MLAGLRSSVVRTVELLMDSVNADTRSRIMRAVPQKNTAPELKLRKALHRMGLRYRLHVKSLPGSPDIVFPKTSVAVFVHGCFWHRHIGCRLTTTPNSRSDFWQTKFDANIERDRRKEDQLRQLGWRCVVIWQCDIEQHLPRAVRNVRRALVSR